jgi:hypothetical protein
MSIKNISKIVTDVKRPIKKRFLPQIADISPKRYNWIMRHRLHILSGLMIVAALYTFTLLDFKNSGLNAFQTFRYEMERIKKSFPEFNTGLITQSLKNINDEIKSVELKAKYYGVLSASSLAGTFVPTLGQIPGTLRNISLASEIIAEIAKNMDYLKSNGFQLMAEQKGDELVDVLKKIKNNVTVLTHLGAEIKNQSFSLKNLSAELTTIYESFNKNYIAMNLGLFRAEDFLEALLAILKSPEDQHLLFIFQNPSEMRPAGGFIGSYGDIVLNQGNLKEIRVDDIYNADRQFRQKIVPPKELQGITTKWGARDANWFFDFPTSAQKIIQFLEQADLHYENLIQFQGAIAINTNVLGAFLDIVGPIKLPDYNPTLTSQNFLKEIQYEVEAGRDKKPGQNPKQILSKLAPILMEKIKNLSGEQKEVLIRRLQNHLQEKDIMMYFKDWKLQNFLEYFDIAGEIIQLPNDFSGDYLAVVNANIGGGKSDAFISQHIALKSEILDNGDINNELSISRSHNGQNEKEWWYRSANKNYLKILVPPKSKIISVKGNDTKALSNNNYDYDDDYTYDIDLKSMEESQKFNDKLKVWIGNEFKKTSFGTWFTTPAGKTETLKITYKTGAELKIGEGMKYKFVFEKQSGTKGSLEYFVTAPAGYIWKESGTDIFKYETEQIKAREIIELTLVKT